jgi:hypothetical protein
MVSFFVGYCDESRLLVLDNRRVALHTHYLRCVPLCVCALVSSHILAFKHVYPVLPPLASVYWTICNHTENVYRLFRFGFM